MPIPIITSIISAISIIVGSLVGAFFSYIINKTMYNKQISHEKLITDENRRFEESFKLKELCDNANVIRLDISTAIYQSIRTMKFKEYYDKYLFMLPINKNYSNAIATLSHKFSLKELNYIYMIYGIIEKVNKDICNISLGDMDNYKNIEIELSSMLYHIYGENYEEILKVDIERIPYVDLYDNDLIKSQYRDILKKLDHICILDNLIP